MEPTNKFKSHPCAVDLAMDLLLSRQEKTRENQPMPNSKPWISATTTGTSEKVKVWIVFFYFSTQMYVIYAEWSSWEISSGEARGAQASPSGGRNFCYRQVLPITTISVQRPSLLKSSQARIQSNGSKRIMSRKTWSRIMSRKTWPRVVWCFSMTGQGARQPDAIKHPSNISTDLTIKQLHNLCN